MDKMFMCLNPGACSRRGANQGLGSLRSPDGGYTLNTRGIVIPWVLKQNKRQENLSVRRQEFGNRAWHLVCNENINSGSEVEQQQGKGISSVGSASPATGRDRCLSAH